MKQTINEINQKGGKFFKRKLMPIIVASMMTTALAPNCYAAEIPEQRSSFLSATENISAEPDKSKNFTLDSVSFDYNKTDKGIEILVSFNDDRMALRDIGMPASTDTTSWFEMGNNSGKGGVSPYNPRPLIGYGKDGAEYEFKPALATQRPATLFASNAPKGKPVTLNIPSINIYYKLEWDSAFNIKIPVLNETTEYNQTIDLGLQKAVLKSVKRTSATTAELIFDLNTGDNKDITIRDWDFVLPGVRKGESKIKGNTCTMAIEFDKKLEEASFSKPWPTFVINGNWNLVIE